MGVTNMILNAPPPTREEAIAYSWKLGRLNYRRRSTQKFLKAAIEKAKLISRKIYFETTRRLGKSSEMLMMFTEHCLEKPSWKAGFFAPVKDGLLDYIEPIIQKTYEECPDDSRPVFNRQRFILEFPNKSSIIFRGSNNQQHRIRRGQEFHEAGIDEARDVDSLDSLVDSVVMPALFSAEGGYLYLSSTPADTRSHPLYRYRQLAEAEGWLIRLTIWDAHRMDPDVYTEERINEWKRETLKSVDGDDKWKREYECEWVVNKSRAAVPEWKGAYVRPVKKDPYYAFYDRYIGIDWGYKDYTAVGFGSYLYREAVLQVESELMFSGTDVRADRIAEAIDRQAVKLWGDGWKATMVSDSADPILINEINVHPRMSFVPVHKAETLDAMLNQFRQLVNQGKILVSPECAMTIHCLANAVWDEKRDKLDQDVFARHFDHLMQLVYLTRNVDFNHNPIPPDYMIDGVRVVDLSFDKPNRKSQDARALEEAFQYG
jgi:hypothetical protein